MGRTKKEPIQNVVKPFPALTPEAREQQLINAAVNLAEKQLLEGTASSQVICHYLKLATEKEKLEKQLILEEIKLKTAKTESLQSTQRIEELYSEAINALRVYSGHGNDD